MYLSTLLIDFEFNLHYNPAFALKHQQTQKKHQSTSHFHLNIQILIITILFIRKYRFELFFVFYAPEVRYLYIKKWNVIRTARTKLMFLEQCQSFRATIWSWRWLQLKISPNNVSFCICFHSFTTYLFACSIFQPLFPSDIIERRTFCLTFQSNHYETNWNPFVQVQNYSNIELKLLMYNL